MSIVIEIGDLLQMIRDGQAQVGYKVTGQLEGRVMSCAICTVHLETRSMSFLLSFKTKVDGFLGRALKPGAPIL
jgi:hypothetical protein